MKKIKYIFLSFIFTYLIYGLFVSRYELSIIDEPLAPKNPKGFFDYRGSTNIHTNLSTGSGSYEDVINAANNSDLDYIIITDLNIFDKSNTNSEGYYDDLLVMIGGEYSFLDSRLLNINSETDDYLIGPGQSQALFTDLLSKDIRDPRSGLFILAHPYKPRFEWNGSLPIGIDGVEIINLKTIWQKAWLNSRASFVWTLLIYPFNPELSFIRLFENSIEKEVQLWDQLSQRRKTLAIAGADAEARVKLFNQFIEFPSYDVLFSLVSNHVLLEAELTGNHKSDQKKIMSAIKNGQYYMGIDKIANPKGFNITIKDKSNKRWPLGSELNWEEGLELVVELPQKPNYPFETIIYKDGKKYMSSNSKDTTMVIHESGVYRAKVRVIPTFPLPDGRKWIPWIYTNNFYVK